MTRRQASIPWILAACFFVGCRPHEQPLASPSLLLIGDSRVDEWPTELLTGWHVARRGIPGEKAVDALERAPRLIAELKPDAVVIFTGVNDLIPIGGYPDRRQKIVSRTANAIVDIAELASGDVEQVIVIPVLPGSEKAQNRPPVWNSDVDSAVTDVNTILFKKLSNKYLNLWTEMVGSNGKLKLELSRDHLHLSPKGYEVLTERVLKQLRPPLRSSRMDD